MATNSGDTANPDVITVVDADPASSSYGRITSRTDLPNIGDGVHHFGYSLDQTRLLVPGMMSNRLHVYDISRRPDQPSLIATRDLAADTGYIAPHTVTPLNSTTELVTMLGTNDPSGGPAGVVLLDSHTGEFVDYFGPGPDRGQSASPKFMYDFVWNARINRAVTTTWGYPKDVFQAPFYPNGNEVTVWDFNARQPIQTANLGGLSGAAEADFLHDGSSYGYTATLVDIVLWEDEDNDGVFGFHKVRSDRSSICDIVVSFDDRYLYVSDWVTHSILQYDITNHYDPVLVGEATVPHPCMMRLSRDNGRLYVTNNVIRNLDDSPIFGTQNYDYGLWQFTVNQTGGGLTSVTADGSAWVDYSNMQKKNNRGPMGPHMMMFDPSLSIIPGDH
jgi:selenium-binding protein 1